MATLFNNSNAEDTSEQSSLQLSVHTEEEIEDGEMIPDELEEGSPVKLYLEEVLQKVKSQTDDDTEQPNCYKDGTFWIRPPNPIFKNLGRPMEYSLPDVFVWLPYFLLAEKKLKCTLCKKTDHVQAKDWCFPRRVIGLEKPYYILTKSFRCDQCEGMSSVNKYLVTFKATSAQSIALLPYYLVSEFPAFMSHKSGLDLNLLQLLRGCCFANGLGSDPFRNIVGEFQDQRYHVFLTKYLERYKDLGKMSSSLPKFEDPSTSTSQTQMSQIVSEMFQSHITSTSTSQTQIVSQSQIVSMSEPQIPSIDDDKKTKKKTRKKKRCTTCGHENHHQCTKRGRNGVCNTPVAEYKPYRRSRGKAG
jgi:hypothetical protein